MRRSRALILILFVVAVAVIPVLSDALSTSESDSSESKLVLPEYRNPVGDEIPIMAWFSFKDSVDLTPYRFKEMRDAGFNIYMSQLSDTFRVSQSVEAARGSGVKVFVNCPESHSLRKLPSLIERYRNNPDVVGYYLIDEPDASQFSQWKEYRDLIYSYDSTKLVFVNLLPIVSPKRLKTKSYEEYLKDYFKELRLPLLSYDNYPITQKDGKISVKADFYKNLEIASSVCKKYDRPFWAFCLATAHYDYPLPSDAQLYFEAFSNLAYGAQGIEYFTYTHPDFSRSKFKSPPIDSLGRKTSTWYKVRKLNREIQSMKSVFLGCSIINVSHTGRKIPDGTKRPEKFPAPFTNIEGEGLGLLISEIINGGRRYTMILNRDVENKQTVKIDFNGRIRRVKEGGSLADFKNKRFSLGAGKYIIFTQ